MNAPAASSPRHYIQSSATAAMTNRIGGFKGRGKGALAPEHGPKQVTGEPGASRIQESHLEARLRPTPCCGSLQRSPDPLQLTGRGWEPALSLFAPPSGLRASPLTRHRRLGTYQHDRLDLPMTSRGVASRKFHCIRCVPPQFITFGLLQLRHVHQAIMVIFWQNYTEKAGN